MNRRDQIVGCIVGGAIGDALGGMYEGQSSPSTLDFSRPAHVSDDTQLTLATCESIQPGGIVDPDKLVERFLFWFRHRKLTGLGASTLKALRDLDAGAHWALSGREGEYSAGNGAAMRVAPLAFCLNPDSKEDRRLLRDLCRITHRNEEAYVGALAIVYAVRLFSDDTWNFDRSLAGSVAERLPETNVRDALLTASEFPHQLSILEASRTLGCSGYVAESVPLAIFAAQRAATGSLESLYEGVIEAGGDTDTIASMAGQIGGARLGLSRISQSLMDSVMGMEHIQRSATEFADKLTKS